MAILGYTSIRYSHKITITNQICCSYKNANQLFRDFINTRHSNLQLENAPYPIRAGYRLMWYDGRVYYYPRRGIRGEEAKSGKIRL